jgi:hypothetical protein
VPRRRRFEVGWYMGRKPHFRCEVEQQCLTEDDAQARISVFALSGGDTANIKFASDIGTIQDISTLMMVSLIVPRSVFGGIRGHSDAAPNHSRRTSTVPTTHHK